MTPQEEEMRRKARELFESVPSVRMYQECSEIEYKALCKTLRDLNVYDEFVKYMPDSLVDRWDGLVLKWGLI